MGYIFIIRFASDTLLRQQNPFSIFQINWINDLMQAVLIGSALVDVMKLPIARKSSRLVNESIIYCNFFSPQLPKFLILSDFMLLYLVVEIVPLLIVK